jgi:hypothetical protein
LNHKQKLFGDLHAVIAAVAAVRQRWEENMTHTFPTEYSADYYKVTRQRVIEKLAVLPFYAIGSDGAVQMIFDSASNLLWAANPAPSAVSQAGLSQVRIGGIGHWRLPSSAELQQFYGAPACPGRGRMAFFDRGGTWQVSGGTIPLGAHKPDNADEETVYLIRVNDFACTASEGEMVDLCMERGWTLSDPESVSGEDLLLPLRTAVPMREQFKYMDYRTTRLPLLETSQFEDAAKGIWECWGMAAEVLQAERVLARNPADDVRDWDVAIDFGTSSTVVAYEENGKRKLLRTGISNWQSESARNYENPTLLEFLDWEGLLKAWQSVAYRPPVEWDHVRASHAALSDFHDSGQPQALVGSLLNNLKQWALLAEDGARTFIRDQTGIERELPSLTARNPVLGVPMTVGQDDPFDPVELYAWLLGLNINWRGRGISLPRSVVAYSVVYLPR